MKDYSTAAIELSIQAMEKSAAALERLGDEYTRGFVRSALIELKAWLNDYSGGLDDETARLDEEKAQRPT
jgi:hypothetical protein